MSLLDFHKRVKLGRQGIVTDTRTLSLREFTTSALPAPPVAQSWSKGLSGWGMMCNDQLGDCTIAGVFHATQIWKLATTGIIPSYPDATIISYYSLWDGYNPNNPATDQGGVALSVLKDWKSSIVGLDGNPLTGFVSINPSHGLMIKCGIAWFGGIYIGVDLPNTAQGQLIWDVTSSGVDGQPGSWGGHCVFVCDYDDYGVTCITWGQLQKMTWNFFNRYVDECYALLSADFLVAGVNPIGLDVPTLLTRLGQIN